MLEDASVVDAEVLLLVISSPVEEEATVVVPGVVVDVPGTVVDDVAGGPDVELSPVVPVVVPPVSSVSTAESQAGRRSRVAAPSAIIEEEI